MTAASGRIATDGIDELRVHQTADPRVDRRARQQRTPRRIRRDDQRYVCLFELRDGLLWRYREYWNPLVSMDVYGGLDEWLDGLATS